MSTLLTGGRPSNLAVNWEQCQGGVWCSLATLNLDHSHFNGLEGVYVIWRAIDRKAVRVGQGIVADRLRAHRSDRSILAHDGGGSLLVTWARLSAAYRDGVERYLATALTPIVGSAFPDVLAIQVNLPGQS